MKNNITFFFFFFLLFTNVHSQESLNWFLPGDIKYNPDVTTPEDFFGQQLGEWHLTHEQSLNYIKEIARESDRAVLQEYAQFIPSYRF